MKTFGEVVKAYRIVKGLTIRELAEKLGKSPGFISMMENNKNAGTAEVETLEKISKILSMNRIQLFYLARKVPPEILDTLHKEAVQFFTNKLAKEF